MTEYIYQVRSNVPLAAVVGLGNRPVVMVGQYGAGLVKRDEVQVATSNGAATADGHRITLELIERYEPPCDHGSYWTDSDGRNHCLTCPHVSQPTAPENRHWKVIRAGNIVVAQGYCYCADPNAEYHSLGGVR